MLSVCCIDTAMVCAWRICCRRCTLLCAPVKSQIGKRERHRLPAWQLRLKFVAAWRGFLSSTPWSRGLAVLDRSFTDSFSKFGNRLEAWSNLVIASPSWLTIRGTLIRGSSKCFEVLFVVHDQRSRRN